MGGISILKNQEKYYGSIEIQLYFELKKYLELESNDGMNKEEYSYFINVNLLNYEKIGKRIEKLSLANQQFLEVFYSLEMTTAKKQESSGLSGNEYYNKHKAILKQILQK